MEEELKLCDSCKKLKPDVQWTKDPFMDEIHNEEVFMNLCEQCYLESCEQI